MLYLNSGKGIIAVPPPFIRGHLSGQRDLNRDLSLIESLIQLSGLGRFINYTALIRNVRAISHTDW